MKSFRDISSPHTGDFKQMLGCQWELIFEDKTHKAQDNTMFRKFVNSVQNRSNVIVLCSAIANGQNIMLGGFTNQAFPSLGESWQHEFDY